MPRLNPQSASTQFNIIPFRCYIHTSRFLACGCLWKAKTPPTKACVISMFHDGHQLYGIVSERSYARYNIFCEVTVRGDMALGRSNANMCLIYSQSARRRAFLAKMWMLPNMRCGWVPVDSIILLFGFIVHSISRPWRQAVDRPAILSRNADLHTQRGNRVKTLHELI